MMCANAGGRVFAWGENEYGQLGVGDKEDRVVPALVAGLLVTGRALYDCQYCGTRATNNHDLE